MILLEQFTEVLSFLGSANSVLPSDESSVTQAMDLIHDHQLYAPFV
jgi:hypothetical protein